MPDRIETLCNRIVELIQKAEGLDGIAFLDSLVEVDKCCNEILADEERALQSERFKSLVIHKCRLFDRKKEDLEKGRLSIRKEFEKLLESDGDREAVQDAYKQYCEIDRNLYEILQKYRDYERSDNRLLVRIEDVIEYERKFHLEYGFSAESFHPFYRIKDYKNGKYFLGINACNYNDLSIDQLYKELEKGKENLEELEEEFEELEYLDEEDYEEYDFESEEEYTEKLEELDDDIYFYKCNIELIKKIIEKKNNIDSN